MKSKITARQREGYESRLPDRVNKRDPDGVLQRYYIEYLYHEDLNFGHVFDNPRTFRPYNALREAQDNFDQNSLATILIFARPYDCIYVTCEVTKDISISLLERLPTSLYYRVEDKHLIIARLEDFISAHEHGDG